MIGGLKSQIKKFSTHFSCWEILITVVGNSSVIINVQNSIPRIIECNSPKKMTYESNISDQHIAAGVIFALSVVISTLISRRVAKIDDDSITVTEVSCSA